MGPETPPPNGPDPPDADAIAIIGMACRFPGMASSPEKLWNMLIEGESAWAEFPSDRINVDGFYHPAGRQGSIHFRGGHFISGSIAAFDAPFFGISAEEAKAVDPQQRILLEVSYEALENGGIRMEDLDGRDVSVFVGSFVKDYEQICLRDSDDQPRYAATGNGTAILSNRLSYFYNINGASMTIDTGCSASLVALHQAAETLRRGHSSMAIAAGTGMILTPTTMMPMSALNLLSKDGKSFTFDHRANGYGRGEGIGVVVMKRLGDALRDNDPIRAVIRASRLNQDGRSQGITHPNLEAQVSNIHNIYTSSNINPNQTAYVECHGTGTQAGDVTELRAISRTISAGRGIDNPVLVGSIKPNIGHTEGAAGVAGVIKAVLVLERGVIPPNINFERGNPAIKFKEWKVKVPTQPTQWPIDGLRRVSVNSFGFGGANAHVILDQAPPRTLPILDDDATKHGVLVTYSAHSRPVLLQMVRNHARHLSLLPQSLNDDADTTLLLDYAFTQNCRRSVLEWRAAVVARTLDELAEKLASSTETSTPSSASSSSSSSLASQSSAAKKRLRVGFAFCGQGAQFARMCLDLCVFAPFRDSLEDARKHLERLGSPFDLLEELQKDAETSAIDSPDVSQPATTAVQVAVVDLLRSWGVAPHCVVGHSSGEIAAAYAAGLITRTTAWEVAYYRGFVAGRLRAKCPLLEGGMLAVKLGCEETQKILGETSSEVEVACINSPTWTTVAGMTEDLDRFASCLGEREVHCIRLPVQMPYHSSHMRVMSDEYEGLLGKASDSEASDPESTAAMYSSVTGQRLGKPSNNLDPEYWARNMTSPVRFVEAVQAMYADGRPDLVVEISPKPTLRGLVRDIIGGFRRGSAYMPVSTVGDAAPTMTVLELAGRAWEMGVAVNMANVMGSTTTRTRSVLTNLPPYPWDHTKTHWFETDLSRAGRFRTHPRKDLIGAPSPESTPLHPRWRGFLRVSELPWLHDHRVQKTIVYPAAGMVVQALEAVGQLVAGREDIDVVGFEVCNVVLAKAMVVPETAHGLEVVLSIKVVDGDVAMGVHEWTLSSKTQDGPWGQNASGSIRAVLGKKQKRGPETTSPETTTTTALAAAQWNRLQETCHSTVVPRQLYEHMDVIGLNYGPTFQNIATARTDADSAAICTIRIPDTAARMPMGFEYPHLIHPATLDAMIHCLFAVECRTAVPTSIDRVFVAAGVQKGAGRCFTGFATAKSVGLRGIIANVVMANDNDDNGVFTSPAVIVEGLRLADISARDGGHDDTGPGGRPFLPNHRNLCSEIKWQEDHSFTQEPDLTRLVGLMAHRHPDLAVLQVGSHSGTCVRVLDFVEGLRHEMGVDAALISRYTFSGPEAGLLLDQGQAAYAESGLGRLMEQRPLPSGADSGVDVDTDADSDSDFPSYDLILTDDRGDVSRLFAFLHPAGLLVQLDSPPQSLPHVEAWATHDGHAIYRPLEPPPSSELTVDIICPTPSNEIKKFVQHLNDIFRTKDAVTRLRLCTPLEAAESSSAGPCIHLAELNGHTVASWNEQDFALFHRLQKSRKNILWLTRASRMDDATTNPLGAAILGLARTIMSEDPSKRIVTLDIGQDTPLNEALAQLMHQVFSTSFLSSSPPETTTRRPVETEFAERSGRVFVPRLVPMTALNRIIEDEVPADCEIEQVAFLRSEHVLALELTKPASAGDWFAFVARPPPGELGPGEIEVEFTASVVFPVDAATCRGRTTRKSIGTDMFGVIVRASPDADPDLQKPGTRVAVFRPLDSAFTNRLRINTAHGLVKKQIPSSTTDDDDNDDNDDADGIKIGQLIPSCHVAAYYGLVYAGELTYAPNPVVLVHASASAHGQAAIQVARLLSATVIATTIGEDSDEQRRVLLEHRGLDESHVLDGDDVVGLAARVRALTGDRGVDVVFDPTNSRLDASLKCVCKSGRIIQLSSHDLTPIHHNPTSSRATVIDIDLDVLASEKPKLIADVLAKVWVLFRSAHGTPHEPAPILPRRTFEIPRFATALAAVDEAPHHGLVTLAASANTVVPVERRDADPARNHISDAGVYVLVGGLGGLGLSIARYLAENGAARLAFISRSGARSQEAKEALALLEQKGVKCGDYRADVCHLDQAQNVLNAINSEMGTVLGVVYCVAVLKDTMFENMTYNEWHTAFAPKVHGSWNVVQTLTSLELRPWLLLLSSTSGVIGNRAQANYAAGNSVLDALAAYWNSTSSMSKHGEGGRAVSLDLGPVLGAGMLVADEQLLNILRGTGFFGIRHRDFLTLVEHSIKTGTSGGRASRPEKINLPAQVITGIGTGGIVRQNQITDPFWTRTALYSLLNTIDLPPADPSTTTSSSSSSSASSSGDNQDLRTHLAACASPNDAAELVTAGLLRMLARSMNMLPEEMDAGRTPNAYGVDSLVAVSVRGWVAAATGVNVAVLEVVGDWTVAELALVVAQRGGFGGGDLDKV